jgi:type I restriction enzyme M protein
VLIINAVKEVRQDKNIAFLEPHHIQRIYQAYQAFQDQEGFCKVVGIDEVLNHNASLNMSLYVSNVDTRQKQQTLDEVYENWQNASLQLATSMKQLFETLK